MSLYTKRFDRNGNIKHHMQSLCAMEHLDYKQRATHAYEQYFMAIAKLRLGDDALNQAFRRMAFNVVARNCDDHTKNFSFLFRQGGRWELAPAYDVTHAHNPTGEWTSQHLMSVNGKFDDITLHDLLTVGERFSVPRAKYAIREVIDAVSMWPEFSQAGGVSPTESDRVKNDFRHL